MKFFELKYENLEKTSLSTSIETVDPIFYSENNQQKSNNLLIKHKSEGKPVMSLGNREYSERNSNHNRGFSQFHIGVGIRVEMGSEPQIA